MKQQILDELSRFLVEMEQELSCCNEQELSKRRLTSRIIKGTMTLMLVLLIANSYFLYQLSTGLSDNLRMVDQMAEQFGRVTGSLSHLTDSVGVIGTHVVTLDSIDVDMAAVSSGIVSISSSLDGISGTVSGLGDELYYVDHSMSILDGQVYGMTGNMRQIGSNVDRMAAPMRIFNSMMPW